MTRDASRGLTLAPFNALSDPRLLAEAAAEAEALLLDGVPLRGLCLYPILGMPEWHAQDTWMLMGLWDILHKEPARGREVCLPMLEALKKAQRLDRLAEQMAKAA